MILAEEIYQLSLSLPENAAREALDFILFLKQRYPQQSAVETVNKQKCQAALARIASVKAHWNGKPIVNRDAL